MTELRCEGLGYVYADGAVRALDSVDLCIAPGESVALVGQNGSGKTTLVRHFNGLLRPSSGRVMVDGVDAATLTVAKLARQVGLVFQDPDRQIFAGSVRSEIEFGPSGNLIIDIGGGT
ncbi:MAG: ABC transporter ATP-binding protein, partial [Candidatus Limnocylindrales bacterium]